MNNKHYIGRRVSRFEALGATEPITGIALLVDDDNQFFAGTRTGRVLEIPCPYGTQAMAEDLLTALGGKSYRGYTAANAVTDPSAELGDGVTVGGIYSLLATRRGILGAGHLAEIAAPVEGDLDHEYGQESFAASVERKLAGTRSYLEKTSESLRLGVESLVDDRMSALDVTLAGITGQVQGLDGAVSTLQQTAGGLSAKLEKLDETYALKADLQELSSTFVTAGQVGSQITQSLKNITLSVSGALGGKASITLSGGGGGGGTLDLTGVRQAFAQDDSEVTISGGLVTFNAGTFVVNSENFSVTREGRMTANSADLTYVTLDAGPGAGGELRSVAALIKGNLYMLGEYDTGSYALYGATKNSGNATLVYASTNYNGDKLSAVLGYDCATRINGDPISMENAPNYTSDRDVKKDIQPMPEKYLRLLAEMEPVVFRYKKEPADAPLHAGYIAQDMAAAIVRAGLTRGDVAALAGKDGTGQMGIVYSDLIPMLHLKIKELEKRIKELEVRT